MSRPCVHCNGSGTEPDPIHEAYVAMTDVIATAQATITLKDELARAVAAYRDACAERIRELESTLGTVLTCFDPPVPGTHMTICRLANADVERWLAVLGKVPGD